MRSGQVAWQATHVRCAELGAVAVDGEVAGRDHDGAVVQVACTWAAPDRHRRHGRSRGDAGNVHASGAGLRLSQDSLRTRHTLRRQRLPGSFHATLFIAV